MGGLCLLRRHHPQCCSDSDHACQGGHRHRVCNTGSKETNTVSSWAPVSCWNLCSCITDENRGAHGGGGGGGWILFSFCRNSLPLSGLGSACISHVSEMK